MVDYTHVSNLIQGEVIRIRERREPHEWEPLLEELYQYLMEQGRTVLLEKLRAAQEYPPPPNDSAADDPADDSVLTPGLPAPGAPDGS